MTIPFFDYTPLRDVAAYCITMNGLEPTGWCRKDSCSGIQTVGGGLLREIERMLNHIVRDIVHNRVVAIGLEMPLTIPLPISSHLLFPFRNADAGRSWGVGRGAEGAMGTIQMVQMLCKRIQEGISAEGIYSVRAAFDLDDLWYTGPSVTFWEAIGISDESPIEDPIDRDLEGLDAQVAVDRFLELFWRGGPWAYEPGPLLNLTAIGLLHSRLVMGSAILHLDTPVVRFPKRPLESGTSVARR